MFAAYHTTQHTSGREYRRGEVGQEVSVHQDAAVHGSQGGTAAYTNCNTIGNQSSDAADGTIVTGHLCKGGRSKKQENGTKGESPWKSGGREGSWRSDGGEGPQGANLRALQRAAVQRLHLRNMCSARQANPNSLGTMVHTHRPHRPLQHLR